jgi:hypothetical protein
MTQVKNAVKKMKTLQTVKKVAEEKPTEAPKKADIFEPMKKTEKETISESTKKLIANFRPTAEERIKNAEKFKILTEKYDHLKTKKDELEKFKISSDGTKERIYFENAEGFKLEVSNSNVITEMLQLAEKTLFNIVNATEKQVQEFVI